MQLTFYIITCKLLSDYPFEFKKTIPNCIDSNKSIFRNITEGYSLKSIAEYIRFLDFALASIGEYYTCINSFYKAEQISADTFELLDKLLIKQKNELIQLIKSLQKKLKNGDWQSTFLND